MDTLSQKSLKLFNMWSSVYDSPLSAWFFNHYYKKVEVHLTNLEGRHLLSAGCGTGTLEIRLARRFPTATILGIDLSEKMLCKARAKTNDLKNITFAKANVESLELSDHNFENIVCIHSFHHYPNQLRALEEFYRVLKPGGRLFLLDGTKDRWLGRLHLKMNMLLYEPGVLYHYKRTLIKLINQAGFRHIDTDVLDPVYCIFICTK